MSEPQVCTVDDGLINPALLPAKAADLDTATITGAADDLRTMGSTVDTKTDEIKTTWGGLTGCYQAPEQAEVYALMDDPATASEDVKDTFSKAAGHLDTYASALEGIKPRLADFEKRAQAFRDEVIDGVWVNATEAKDAGFGDYAKSFGNWLVGNDQERKKVPWYEDGDTVAKNQDFLKEVGGLYEEVSAAAATCATGINGLTSLPPDQKTVRGISKEDFYNPEAPMPWGSPRDEDRNCPESVGHGAYQFGKNTVEGLGQLISYNPETGDWGDWNHAGQAWMGTGNVLMSLVVSTSPVAQWLNAGLKLTGRGDSAVSKWLDERNQVSATVVTGLVGIDLNADDPFHKWKEDGVATFTESFLNVGTMFIPGAGEVGAAVKVAGMGSKVLKIGGTIADFAVPGGSWLVKGGAHTIPVLKNVIKFGDDLPVNLLDDIAKPGAKLPGVNTASLTDDLAGATKPPKPVTNELFGDGPAGVDPHAGSRPANHASEPASVKPEVEQPTSTKPEAGQPSATKPEAGQPSATKPEAGQPSATKPEVEQPSAKPEPAKPEPGAPKPEPAKPEPGEPEAAKPEAGKPEPEPATPEPETAKPEPETAATKPEPHEPVSPHDPSPEPAGPHPDGDPHPAVDPDGTATHAPDPHPADGDAAPPEHPADHGSSSHPEHPQESPDGGPTRDPHGRGDYTFDADGRRHLAGDPPHTYRDVHGKLHDAETGRFAPDTNRPETDLPVERAEKGKSYEADLGTEAQAAHDTLLHERAGAETAAHDAQAAMDDLAAEAGVDPDLLRGSSQEVSENLRDLVAEGEIDPATAGRLGDAAAAQRTAMQAFRDASERLGDEATAAVSRGAGETPLLNTPGMGAGRFDNVALGDDPPHLSFYEGKGGNSPLGYRTVDGVRVQQGTASYLNAIAEVDPRFATELQRFVEAHPNSPIAKAIKDGTVEIRYDLVQALPNGTVKVTPFVLDRSALKIPGVGG